MFNLTFRLIIFETKSSIRFLLVPRVRHFAPLAAPAQDTKLAVPGQARPTCPRPPMTGAYQSPPARARVSRHSRSNQSPARRARQRFLPRKHTSQSNARPVHPCGDGPRAPAVVRGHHLTRLPHTSKPSQTTETTLSGMPWNARLAKSRAKHVTSSYKTGFNPNLDLGVDERRSRKPKCRSNGTGTTTCLRFYASQAQGHDTPHPTRLSRTRR